MCVCKSMTELPILVAFFSESVFSSHIKIVILRKAMFTGFHINALIKIEVGVIKPQ